jgi:hypothetical protein
MYKFKCLYGEVTRLISRINDGRDEKRKEREDSRYEFIHSYYTLIIPLLYPYYTPIIPPLYPIIPLLYPYYTTIAEMKRGQREMI